MKKLINIACRVFRGIMRHGETLTQRATRGAVWMTMGSGSEQAIQMLQTLVLVRLLERHDFGVFRVAMITMISLRVFTNTGFNQAIIQRKKLNREMLDTAWVIQIARNMLQLLALYLAADWIAGFFNEPRIALMLRVVSIQFIFLALYNPGVQVVVRDMNFNLQPDRRNGHHRRRAILEKLLGAGCWRTGSRTGQSCWIIHHITISPAIAVSLASCG